MNKSIAYIRLSNILYLKTAKWGNILAVHMSNPLHLKLKFKLEFIN